MDERSLAISILQKARDALGDRLTQRIVEGEHEIAADAEGASYLSEIETIYEQIGGRLAHLNARLANLPPAAATAPAPADATANEIIYADLATAYPTGLELESAAPMPLLALSAPANGDERPAIESVADDFANIVVHVNAGDLTGAARLISELFDIRPSHARRGAQAFVRQIASYPDLVRKIVELGRALEDTNEYAAATLLVECFEFQAIEALAIVHGLKSRLAGAEATR
jgi:hypothetical protein